MWQPAYPNLRELLSADERGAVSIEQFDDLLWYFMTAGGGPAERPENSSGPRSRLHRFPLHGVGGRKWRLCASCLQHTGVV